MSRPSRQRARAALLALTVVAVAGYGAAGASARGAAVTPAKETDSLATSVWAKLDTKQRASALRALSPERAAALTRFLDQLNSGGKVPVATQGRVAGFVEASTLTGNRMPRAKTELASVKDAAGKIVAYWAGPLGVVDRVKTDLAGFDPAKEAAKGGLEPDGSVKPELISQTPVATTVPVAGPVLEPPATTVPPTTTVPPPSTSAPPPVLGPVIGPVIGRPVTAVRTDR